uniref:Peptidase A1 domain-containing protein n=1 Tax=Alexandrium monilatum TaxID=311494 RepID=A0A7S4QIG0_9DINO
MHARGRRRLAAACLALCAARCSGRCTQRAQLYGNIDNPGYYYVDLLVGSRGQRTPLAVDTANSGIAFSCEGCSHCGRHMDTAFNPNTSRTASWLPCGTHCRGQCRHGGCYYSHGFSDGSGLSGRWLTDQVRLGGGVGANMPHRVMVGCNEREAGQLYRAKANGILGLGPTSSVLRDLAPTSSVVCGPKSFALCLAEWGGSLQMGRYERSRGAGPLNWVPMKERGHGYMVPLSAMSVDGHAVDFRAWGSSFAQVDAGTTRTYMASRPFSMLRSLILRHCARRSRRCGASSPGGSCWLLPHGQAGLAHFPNITVHIGAARVQWTPRAYLRRQGRRWCLAFERDGPRSPTVLGLSFLLYHEIVFDVGRHMFGIAEAQCPESQERPSAPPPTVQPYGGRPAGGPPGRAFTQPVPAVPAVAGVAPTGAEVEAESAIETIKEVGQYLKDLETNLSASLQQFGPLLHQLPRWSPAAEDGSRQSPQPVVPAPAPLPAPAPAPAPAPVPAPPAQEPTAEASTTTPLPLDSPGPLTDRQFAIAGFATAVLPKPSTMRPAPVPESPGAAAAASHSTLEAVAEQTGLAEDGAVL